MPIPRIIHSRRDRKAPAAFVAALACLTCLLSATRAADVPTVVAVATHSADATLRSLQTGWEEPARTYKPHTRWWWPGNALTNADITWQLEQMAAQGIGGVEIMSAWKM